MTSAEVNFRGLNCLWALFLFRVWLHRARLILVRLIIIVVGTYVVYKAMQPGGLYWSSNSGGEINLGLPIFIIFGLWIGTMTLIGLFWQAFALDNHGELIPAKKLPSSSFLKHLYGNPMHQIGMEVDGRKLYFQRAIYKEGGFLVSWREYKLDLAIRYEPNPPVELPHIVADATPRDGLKASNLRQHLPGYLDFRAEGQAGQEYRLFADADHTVDALAILTPDVLHEVLESLPGADIELDQQSVWFVYRNMKMNETSLRNFVEGVGRSLDEIDKQLRPYRVKAT